MMSLETIRELSESAARRARRARKEPWEATPEALEKARNGDISAVKIPFLGNYSPMGWHRERDKDGDAISFFVDITGLGHPGEPALTMAQFIAKMKPGFGYALIEQGQFQGYVGVFARNWRAK